MSKVEIVKCSIECPYCETAIEAGSGCVKVKCPNCGAIVVGEYDGDYK